MSLILAIDQSTSATKAVLFDATGKVLDKASRDHRQIYPQPGWVEHDAEEIWRNVLAVIREIVRTQPQETFPARRPEHHQPARNRARLRSQNRQAVAQRHRLAMPARRSHLRNSSRRQGHENLVRRKTGLKIDTYFSASKLKWLIAEKPALAAKLKSGDAVIGTIDALSDPPAHGGKVFATDFTNASRTLLFDIGKLRWDEQLCKLFACRCARCRKSAKARAQFGETDAGGILPKRVPIVGVMGDSQASLFAQRCFQPGMAKATFGTGTSVLLNIGDTFSRLRKRARSRRWRGSGAASRLTRSRASSISPPPRSSG